MADDDFDTLLAKLAATPRRRPPAELLELTRFELVRRLGGGGFGDVYEARDREHGTRVALKVLRSSRPDWVLRFKREFRVVADLVHPNLVHLHELFCEGERWYLTMELVDGVRLDHHVAERPDELRACFAQLALGVDALHRAGCLHRDLKPSNALVEPGGRVVVIDFGLTVATRGPLHTAEAGTPPFMAPELSGGGEPTEASDWFAFGVMLYAALAGRLPFQGSEDKRQPPPPLPPGAAPELEALARALLAADPAARPGADPIFAALDVSADRTPARRAATWFAGRRGELDALAQALARGRERAVVATIDGEPGMGKSSLLAAFADAARAAGAQVHAGRCHEAESVPYKGVDGVIDALCAALRRLPPDEAAALAPARAGALIRMFPVLEQVAVLARGRGDDEPRSPRETRRAGVVALRELLAALARRAPVALILDDLQWASADGVRLLLDLLEAPAPPLLIVLAHRREAAGRSPALDQLRDGLAALPEVERVHLPIEPLEAGEVAAVLRARGGATPGLDTAIRETGGHPYLLAYLLEGAPGGADLSSVVADELARLEPAERAVLEVVAIADAPLRPAIAFAAAQVPRDPAVLDLLRRRKLIDRLADGDLEPFHDRVREVLVTGLPADREAALHRRLAAALEAGARVEPERLARHHRAGGDLSRALEWTRRAARDATAALAFERAAELCARAVELAPDERGRLAALDDLADAYALCGRRGAAGQVCLDAAEVARRLGDPEAEADRRARAGEHLLLGGQLERGLGLLGDALAEVGVAMPASTAVAVAESINLGAALAARGLALGSGPAPAPAWRRLELELAVSRALSLTDLRAPLIATRAVLDALDAGEPAAALRALALFVVNNSARAPDHPLVADAEARTIALADQVGGPLARAWADLARGFRAALREEHRRALEVLAAAARGFAAAAGHAREAAIARLLAAIVCGNGVDLRYARDHHAAIRDEALDRGDQFAATWAQMSGAWLCLAADAPAQARAELAAARATWPRAADSLFAANAILNEIAIALYETPDLAWAEVERLEPELRALFSSLMPYPRTFFCRIAGNAALAAHRAGAADRDRTDARLDRLAEEAADLPHAFSCRQVLAAHRRRLAGDVAGAIAALDQAARHWREVDQVAQAGCADLRRHQLAGDATAAPAAAAALRAITVADPERYARLFVG